MPILVFALAFILLVAAIDAARIGRWSWLVFFVCGLTFSLGPPLLLGCVIPAIVCQFLVLAGLVALLRSSGHAKRLPLAVMPAATALVYVGVGYAAMGDVKFFDDLRAQYPYESMEDRLPEPGPAARTALSSAAAARLEQLEADWADGSDGWRAHLIRKLHEDTVGLFVNAPSFGVRRMYWPLFRERETPAPIPQPVPRASPVDVPEAPALSSAASDALAGLHRYSAFDFANFASLGEAPYVKDRRHVAGFRPHRLTQLPAAPGRLALETVDLVGLLRHPEPVAYLTADLPRMDELRAAPTRPLDPFEAAALDRVRAGDDLITADAGPYVRLFGAIRSGRQCVDCHGGRRGDLLGAFSYTLRHNDPAGAGK